MDRSLRCVLHRELGRRARSFSLYYHQTNSHEQGQQDGDEQPADAPRFPAFHQMFEQDDERIAFHFHIDHISTAWMAWSLATPPGFPRLLWPWASDPERSAR